LLCGGHETVAGVQKVVDARNSFGSVGQGRDRLRSSDARNFAQTEMPAPEQLVVSASKHNHDPLGRDLRWHGGHYQGKQSRICRLECSSRCFNGLTICPTLTCFHSIDRFVATVSQHLSGVGLSVLHARRKSALTFFAFLDLTRRDHIPLREKIYAIHFLSRNPAHYRTPPDVSDNLAATSRFGPS